MIIGIGTDLCDIRRIEKTLERYGERFTGRYFSNEERAQAQTKQNQAAFYAKRFAAKEACVKALGSGVAQGVYLKDIIITNNNLGQPMIDLRGGAEKLLLEKTQGISAQINVSLSDEYPYAQAFVVISSW